MNLTATIRPTIGLVLAGVLLAAGDDVPAPGTVEHARAAPADSGSYAWVEREAVLMGTRFRLRLRTRDRAAGLRAAEGALAAVRGYEDLLSTWRPGTELSRLNRSPVGRTVSLGTVDSPLRSVLRRVQAWSRRTGGAFEPAVGALVDAWALRGAGRTPSEDELRRALAATGSEGFRLDAEAGTATRLDPAAWIDAGGFGKGVALEAAARALASAGIHDAYLDFGGQVLVVGGAPGRHHGWPVSVAHPDRRLEPATELELEGVSAATTGASERHVKVEGRRHSHVVDPRSGRPVPGWGSVTVVASDPLAADVVSTALFVLGPEEGMAWARGRHDVGVLFLIPEGDGRLRRRWNEAMETWLDEDRRASADTLEPGSTGPEGSAGEKDRKRDSTPAFGMLHDDPIKFR